MNPRVRFPTKEELQCIIDSVYQDDSSPTGLRWKIKRLRSSINDPALTTVKQNGYFHGRIGEVYYLAHRVVFFLVKGYWPTEDIDHIDGDKQNNTVENLRETDRSLNNANTCRKGYSWSEKHQRFIVCVQRGKKYKTKRFKKHEEHLARLWYLNTKDAVFSEAEGNWRWNETND